MRYYHCPVGVCLSTEFVHPFKKLYGIIASLLLLSKLRIILRGTAHTGQRYPQSAPIRLLLL